MNFHKNLLVGVNIDSIWLNEVDSMFNYKVSPLSFKYLRLKIGTNP